MQAINNDYIQEDEIDLKELFGTIWKNKFKIVLFTSVITFLTILYTLSIPNSYSSKTILIPQGQAKVSLGGLGALAGMAGIDLGGGGELNAITSFKTIIDDFSFEKKIIQKYDLINKLVPKHENLVFALGFDTIYNFMHDDKKTKDISKEDELFNTYKTLKNMISISSDKKTSLITLSVTSTDRFLAKQLVEIYLKELTLALRDIEMKNVQKQIVFYNKELANSTDISLNQQLGQLVTSLVQKKVLSKANELYNVKQLIKPLVANIKEKTKPKRGLIVIVSFITSIILSILMVFFLEFIESNENDKLDI